MTDLIDRLHDLRHEWAEAAGRANEIAAQIDATLAELASTMPVVQVARATGLGRQEVHRRIKRHRDR